MITLSHLTKVFDPKRKNAPTVTALDDVSLHVERGEVMGIVGPSGSGKSTLARCINLLERPTAGTVTVDGQELTALGDKQVRQARRNIGMIFQQFNLLDSRTALANVEHPLELAGTPRSQRSRRAAALLDRVGLADKHHSYPSQLSGGQKQRVAIARALAAEPHILLCDEATSALDQVSTESILSLVRQLTDELGLTTVLITHEMHVVKRVCDAVTLLEGGKVVDAGHLSDVVARPDSPLAARLLPPPPPTGADTEAAVVDVTVGSHTTDTSVISELVRRFDVDVDVVGGSVETIGGERFGRLQLELHGTADAQRAAVNHLAHLSMRDSRQPEQERHLEVVS